jgi:hypothetical protein
MDEWKYSSTIIGFGTGWLRRYATSRKVAGPNPDEVIGKWLA